MKKQRYIVEIEMPDGDMVSPGWLQDLIQQDCDNERNKGRQTVSVRDAQLPSNLDEAAVEQANLIYPENIRMGHVAKHDVNLLTRRGFIKGFKAGAKWMAGQGVTKEAVIGMATEEISVNISQQTLNELDLCPGDKVVVQIRKAK